MLIEIQRQIELKNKDSQEQNEKIKELTEKPLRENKELLKNVEEQQK